MNSVKMNKWYKKWIYEQFKMCLKSSLQICNLSNGKKIISSSSYNPLVAPKYSEALEELIALPGLCSTKEGHWNTMEVPNAYAYPICHIVLLQENVWRGSQSLCKKNKHSRSLRSTFIDINSKICTPKKRWRKQNTCTDEHFRP